MGLTITKKRTFNLNVESKDWIVYTIGLVCLFLFSISAYSKIVDHERFVSGLSAVKYIGHYASFISWAVPLAEVTVALLLLFPQTNKMGSLRFYRIDGGVYALYCNNDKMGRKKALQL